MGYEKRFAKLICFFDIKRFNELIILLSNLVAISSVLSLQKIGLLITPNFLQNSNRNYSMDQELYGCCKHKLLGVPRLIAAM